MSTWRRLIKYAITGVVVSLPFTFMHLVANPDDARITPLQHATAALANFFGPWGGHIVRLVDFPNAGLRAFNWTLAISLTLVGGLLLVMATRLTRQSLQILLTAFWALFLIVWFGVGLQQIADGLL